jgi:hypothetical protein
MCLRDGVEIQVPLSMFDSVDVEAERKKGLDEGFNLKTLGILDWSKQEYLQCPDQLESSYALKDGNGAVVGEANHLQMAVTFDLVVGFLDYVLFESPRFEQYGCLFLPGSFKDLKNGGE